MGRKAWMFVGSELAGQRAAIVMSLVQSARLNGHDPWVYLRDVLQRLPDRGLAAAPMAASMRRGTMTLLTQAVMVRANIAVDGMSAQQKVELADEIYVQQPNCWPPSLCCLATLSTCCSLKCQSTFCWSPSRP